MAKFRIAMAAVIGAAALGAGVPAAQAQYVPCTPNPLSWPFCVAGAAVGTAGAAVGTAAAIATAPFGGPYYYGPGYYYAPGYYYRPAYYYPGRRHHRRHRRPRY